MSPLLVKAWYDDWQHRRKSCSCGFSNNCKHGKTTPKKWNLTHQDSHLKRERQQTKWNMNQVKGEGPAELLTVLRSRMLELAWPPVIANPSFKCILSRLYTLYSGVKMIFFFHLFPPQRRVHGLVRHPRTELHHSHIGKGHLWWRSATPREKDKKTHEMQMHRGMNEWTIGSGIGA